MRVLQSFPAGLSTNPYLVQLCAHLAPEPEVLGFTWHRALARHYDVFHVHWPDALLRGSNSVRSSGRRMLFRLLLLRLWIGRNRTAVVRTLHDSHGQGLGPGTAAERDLLARLDRRTTLWIRLNPAAPVSGGREVRTIQHGDYREWFTPTGAIDRVPGLLLYFGLIRPNKGVADLIDAFTALAAGPDDDPVSLRVVGSPTTTDVGAEALLAAVADTRVSVSLGHAGDAELAGEISQCELVVLPYRDEFGSEASVLALSLGRPILVPSDPTAEALSAEVGRGWVFTYPGVLSAAVLASALARCRAARSESQAQPDLSARAWPVIAAQHRSAYASAVKLAGGGRRKV